MADTGVLRMGATTGPSSARRPRQQATEAAGFTGNIVLNWAFAPGTAIGVAGRQRLMRRNAGRDDPA